MEGHGLKIVKTLEPDSLGFEYQLYYDIVFLSSFLFLSFLFFSSSLPPFLPLFIPFLFFLLIFLQKLLWPSTISGNYISEQKHKNCCHLGAYSFLEKTDNK